MKAEEQMMIRGFAVCLWTLYILSSETLKAASYQISLHKQMHGVISLKECNSRKQIPTKISSTNGQLLCTESQLLNLYRRISCWRPFL